MSTHILLISVRGSFFFFFFYIAHNKIDINPHFHPIDGAALGIVTFTKRNHFHILTNGN